MFVTLSSSLFVAFHACLLLGSSLWYNLFATQGDYRKKKSLAPTEPVLEVNDDNYEKFIKHITPTEEESNKLTDEKTFYSIIYIVLLILSVFGAVVNLLVVVAIRLQKRLLFLPWLVFHLMIIMGCFAGGIYLALHYTLLQTNEGRFQDQAFAIVSLFPIVGGIFLIFLWILYDQAFIQMGRSGKSNGDDENSIHTSSTSVNKSVSASGSTYGSTIISTNFSPYDLPKRLPDEKHIYTKTQSLPRPAKGRKHKIREFSINIDMNLLKMKKSKSLEQILEGSSNNSSIGGTPNVWIAERRLPRQAYKPDSPDITDLRQRAARRSTSFDNLLSGTLVEIRKQQQPIYHTLDRRGQPKLSTFKGELVPRPSSAVPRQDHNLRHEAPPLGQLHRSRRSRSVEHLLEPDARSMNFSSRSHVSTSYLSAWDYRDFERPKSSLDLRSHRGTSGPDTVRSAQSVKSVTIAPKVTEFHYSEDPEISISEAEVSRRIDPNDSIASSSLVPEPVFPAAIVPPPPPLPNNSKHVSWINKFSPLKPKTGFTRDQIIEYYCSNGDVAL